MAGEEQKKIQGDGAEGTMMNDETDKADDRDQSNVQHSTFNVHRSSFNLQPSSLSFQCGRVKVGPFMLLLGVLVHFLIPGLFLYGAWGLDRHWGTSLTWPMWVRVPLGGVLLAVSLFVEGASLPEFFRRGGSPAPLQPTEALVVTGPYRYCRHPIYVAYIGYLIGPGIMLGLRSIFLLAAIWWACLAMEARFVEERQLRRRFGEQFEAYRRATPFMIPRFWRRR